MVLYVADIGEPLCQTVLKHLEETHGADICPFNSASSRNVPPGAVILFLSSGRFRNTYFRILPTNVVEFDRALKRGKHELPLWAPQDALRYVAVNAQAHKRFPCPQPAHLQNAILDLHRSSERLIRYERYQQQIGDQRQAAYA